MLYCTYSYSQFAGLACVFLQEATFFCNNDKKWLVRTTLTRVFGLFLSRARCPLAACPVAHSTTCVFFICTLLIKRRIASVLLRNASSYHCTTAVTQTAIMSVLLLKKWLNSTDSLCWPCMLSVASNLNSNVCCLCFSAEPDRHDALRTKRHRLLGCVRPEAAARGGGIAVQGG